MGAARSFWRMTAADLRLRRATLGVLAAALLTAAIVLLTFWLWLEAPETGRCNTSLPDSPFATALVPVHVAAAAALTACLGVLSAARAGTRRPGRATAWGLAAVWLLVVGCFVAEPVLSIVALIGVFVAPIVGVAVLLAIVIRTVALARPRPGRWQEHAASTHALLWGLMLLGIPASLASAWLSGANPFCF